MSSSRDCSENIANTSRFRQRDPGSKPRRYHTKSRYGCLTCKRRRIKCGEERPECRNCWEKAFDCVYPPAIAATTSSSSSSELATHPASSWASLSESHTLPAIDRDGHRKAEILTAIQSEPIETDTERLMEHFSTHTVRPWMGDSLLQEGMQRYAIQASATRPYLYHAVLAMSAAHVSRSAPSEAKYKHLSILHYQYSLERYCEYLRGEIDAKDTDAMFATCVLLAIITFTHLDEHEMLGEHGISRTWVRAMKGTKFLLDTPEYYLILRTGNWSALVQEYNEFDEATVAKYLDPSPRCAEELSTVRMLEEVVRSAGGNEQTGCLTGISMLQDLVRLKPTPETIGRFAFQLTRLPHHFFDLVDAGDVPALAIVGFWCALFSRIDSWWVAEPARVECRRIAAELSGYNDGGLGEVKSFLAACGETG